MISFRQKILISYIIALFAFGLLTIPIVTRIVRLIAAQAMEDRADEVIAKIKTAPNVSAMINLLEEQRVLIFFRLSILTKQQKILFDSHKQTILGENYLPDYIVNSPEVLEALKTGIGYEEGYSNLLQQRFSYLAKTFDFHGKTYIIRTAFPSKYFNDLARDCEVAFLAIISAILVLYSIITWLIISHFTKPIQQIILAVSPYQEGKQSYIPEIKLKGINSRDEFNKLAITLNSLSSKVQKQIDTLTSERNEKEAILESLVEGVIAVESDMTVTYANGSASRILQKKSQDLVGHKFSIGNESDSYSLIVRCQAELKALTDTITIVKSNGIKAFYDVVAAPIGLNRGAIFVMQDKSSHYKLLTMRKEFIANASHELKTPITIIQGFAETLHENPDLPRDVQIDVTGKIVNNCKRMTYLIKDLLTLSDIENIPHSRLVDCDLHQIAQGCSDMLLNIYPDAQISIHKPNKLEMRLEADPYLIERAMFNLIENAIKYSEAPAKVEISMDKQDDRYKIVISDQGIGIPAADLEHIFERFYRVNRASKQKYAGFSSGLGLSIVQTIIHKHSGQIFVKSQVGVGTVFTILLPC